MNFSFRRRLERDFFTGIQRLFASIFKNCIGLTPQEIINYLSMIGDRIEVKRLCENLARRMVGAVRADNEKTWREAARKGTLSKEIREALRKELNSPMGLAIEDIVLENSKLISSVPREIAQQISLDALKRYQNGERYEDALSDMISKAPHLSRNRAKLIARTETSKANEAMTEVRARSIGCTWYFWRSSHDERVRHSHSMMDGVLCSFDYPPNPEGFFDPKGAQFANYHAGCCPNCRCYAEPLVDEYDLPDSFRVSVHGQKPKYMRKAQFLDMIKGT